MAEDQFGLPLLDSQECDSTTVCSMNMSAWTINLVGVGSSNGEHTPRGKQ